MPGTSVAEPSVLVIEASAEAAKVSVSVAELLAGLVSVMPAPTVAEAVLASEPVAAGSMLQVAV